METIKAIGMSICVTLVITSIFSMLMPDTKLDKVVNFAISLFFLTSLVTPFFKSDIDLGIDIKDIVMESKAANIEQAAQKQFYSLAEKNIATVMEKYLENQDINIIKIEANINKSDDTNISINKLMVYINQDEKDSAERIKSLCKREVGVTPSVIIVN